MQVGIFLGNMTYFDFYKYILYMYTLYMYILISCNNLDINLFQGFITISVSVTKH